MSDPRGLVLSRPRAGIAQLEFDQPARRNPIDEATGGLLIEALESIEADAEVRAVVVTGRGGTFSAGGDIDRIAELPSTPEDRIAAGFTRRFAVSQMIWGSPKPFIAAISGPVVGAAFGLAMACDVRVGDGTAMFLAPFSHMGLVPDYGLSWLLPRAVGAGAALEISLLSERIGAEDAHRLGILNRICADPLADALRMAERIAARPAYGVAHTKRLAHAAADRSFADGLADEVAVQARGFHEPEVQAQIAAYTRSIGSRRPPAQEEGGST